MSAAQHTQQYRCRLDMQPPGLNIYASQSRTKNARTCRDEESRDHRAYGRAGSATRTQTEPSGREAGIADARGVCE